MRKPLLLFLASLAFASAIFADQGEKTNKTRRSRPNPEDAHDLFALSLDPSVAKELGIDRDSLKGFREEQFEDLRDAAERIKQSRNLPIEERTKLLRELSTNSQSKKITVLDELLPPEKMKRLQQFAYRLEIVGNGYERSIDEGWMSEKLKLSKEQRDTLVPQLQQIDIETARQIEDVLANAEDKVKRLLTDGQRQTFEDSLGPRPISRIKHPSEIFGSSAVR